MLARAPRRPSTARTESACDRSPAPAPLGREGLAPLNSWRKPAPAIPQARQRGRRAMSLRRSCRLRRGFDQVGLVQFERDGLVVQRFAEFDFYRIHKRTTLPTVFVRGELEQFRGLPVSDEEQAGADWNAIRVALENEIARSASSASKDGVAGSVSIEIASADARTFQAGCSAPRICATAAGDAALPSWNLTPRRRVSCQRRVLGSLCHATARVGCGRPCASRLTKVSPTSESVRARSQ